ncbi:MAG: hypothetical protein HY316_06390 [Acidobacteria bacterium]|nr:hypothetical protein [Acidobacteriota bacterium]
MGELLMLASLLTFASTGFMTLVKHGRKGKVNPEQLAYQQLILQGRETVDRMVQEIGRAGTSAPEATADDLDANSANSNRIAAPQFLVATPTHVIFEADLDSDGSVERVEYRLNGETLERSAVLKFPEGGAPSPRYEAMVSSVDNGAMPLFSYVGDPFGPVPAQGDSGAVRILLLLRAPSKQNKQPYQTVGFEGIAHRQNAVAAHQSNPSERSSLLDETGSAPSFADDEMPIQETYARKWTLR